MNHFLNHFITYAADDVSANPTLKSYLESASFDYERKMVNILKEQMGRCYKELFQNYVTRSFSHRMSNGYDS